MTHLFVRCSLLACAALICATSSCATLAITPSTTRSATLAATTRSLLEPLMLDYDTPTDPILQTSLETIHARLRTQFDMTDAQAACGVCDLLTGRVALIHPDRIEYAASTAKVGILYAYFVTHPEAATNIDPAVKHELGEMAKASSNEMAAKYSQLIGLETDSADSQRGRLLRRQARRGHLGRQALRPRRSRAFGDPVGDTSHGATVRQLMRFFVLARTAETSCRRRSEQNHPRNLRIAPTCRPMTSSS